jgi:selenocysteine lyase/cysteine desulfurase
MKALVASREAFGMTFACAPGYLDTPSVGIPPLPAVDALLAAIRDWQVGATIPARFDDSVDAARRAFAVLCGVPAPTVTIGGSVSELVGLTASAAPDGARVLTAAGEFASVIFPFAAHARRGVTIDEVPVADIPTRAADYDYVAASAVQSRDGTVLDLEALRDAVAGRGTRVILDVTHACGWLPLRLDWADAVVGCGYKWLLSPRGVAWMAIREDYAAGLTATSAGWYGGETPWDSLYGLPLRQAAGNRRFDTSPAWLCHLGAASVLPALAATDPRERYAHCTGLANALRAELGLPPAGSAIVSVAAPGVAEHLAGAGVRASIRDGKARLGFFLYNNADDLDRAVSALVGKISGKVAQ